MRYLVAHILVILAIPLAIKAQTESVHIQLDKVVCRPSDTVWFRGNIFEGNGLSHYSKNLYVELYDDSNKLCRQEIFPIINGISIGQIKLPRHSGLYWLRGYTRNSPDFLQSITIRSADRAVVIRKMLDEKLLPLTLDTPGLFFNTVYTKKGISCTIIPDSNSLYNDRFIKLVLKNYETLVGSYAFRLNKDRQRNILINTDSVQGYLSLNFYHKDTLIAIQNIYVPPRHLEDPVTVTRTRKGYQIQMRDTGWEYSVAVIKATEQNYQADLAFSLPAPGFRKKTDSAWLSYTGKLSQPEVNKAFMEDKKLAILFESQGKSNLQILPVDSAGDIALSGLYFFDAAYIQYELSGHKSSLASSECKLEISTPKYKPFVSPDSTSFEMDTLNLPEVENMTILDTVKYMSPVIVEPRWMDRNKSIDVRYTSGRFSAPAHFSFNLLNADTKYDHDIMGYLQNELPGFCGGNFLDTPRYLGKPVIFYLNEELINWKVLPLLARLQNIAYAKVLEEGIDDDRFIRMVSDIPCDSMPSLAHPEGFDNHPRAMICVYTRKDEDLRSLPGEMGSITLKGYCRPVKWRLADWSTIFWAPYVNTSTFQIPDESLGSQPATLIVQGVNRSGNMFHFETRIQSGNVEEEATTKN